MTKGPGDSLTWRYDPSPATDDDITTVENSIGYRFPDDFREFAKHYSGGTPNERDFEFLFENNTFYTSVVEFFTLLPENDRNLVKWMITTEFFPSGLVPFAQDGGGNYICFDYRSDSKNPSVVFWHKNAPSEDDASFVANSFTEFLNLLHEPDDDEDLD